MLKEHEEEYKKVAEEVLKIMDGKTVGTSWKIGMVLINASLEEMNMPKENLEEFMRWMSTEFFILSRIKDENLANELRKKSDSIPF